MISSKHADQQRVGLAAQRRRQVAELGTPKRVIISGNAAGHDTLRRVRTFKRSAKTKTVAGVWIDRRKAVIAIISAAGDALTEIHAGVERKPSRVAGVQSTTTYESQLVESDDRRQREFTGHIGRYYDQVASALGETHDVFVFGPGEAKGEFQKHLDHHGPKNRVIAMQAAGGLSTRQILAKVRSHFHPKHM